LYTHVNNLYTLLFVYALNSLIRRFWSKKKVEILRTTCCFFHFFFQDQS